MFLIEDASGLRPRIHGRITLASARIGARLLIRNAILAAPATEQRGSIYERPTSIGSALNGRRLSVGAEVTVEGDCQVTGRIDMSMAEMSSMSVTGSSALRTPGGTALDLTNADIQAQFLLGERVSVEGVIQLAGAAVHGTLSLHGQLSRPERLTLVDGSAMSVQGDVRLEGPRATGGGVNFRGATLGSLTARAAA